MLEFFKKGGVFFFDEEDSRSEDSFYKLEDLMGEEEGENIVEAYLDEDGYMCIYYDCSVISEDEAIDKYYNGDYKKYL